MPTSTNKPASSRKKSQNARILESIEMLLALQEEQDQSRHGEQALILEQLDALESKLAGFQAKDIERGEQGEAGENTWNTRLNELEERFEKKLGAISKGDQRSFGVNCR